MKTFDKTIAERNQIEKANTEEESAFLRQKNENLDKYWNLLMEEKVK